MRKLFKKGAAICCLAVLSAVSLSILMAANNQGTMNPKQKESSWEGRNDSYKARSQSDYAQNGSDQCCQPCEQPCYSPANNSCWCCYVCYEPVYYNAKRCCEYDVICRKKCCRRVPRNYCELRCKYVPEYYTKTECCYEKVDCGADDCSNATDQCARPFCYAPKEVESQCVRYVPNYYYVTQCRYEFEYYYVYENMPCKKWICEPRCQYVPRYYWKRVCTNECCETPCPTSSEG